MAVYEFTLAFHGGLDEATLDALFEAGCGDMTFSGNKSGLAYADVTREASSFLEAVLGAIRQIESVRGLRVESLQADGLVTVADIAARLGRNQGSVRLLVNGAEGPGDFPAPATQLRDGTKLWRWPDVAEWANRALGADVDPEPSSMAPVVNAALTLRRGEAGLSEPERRALLELVTA